MLKVAHHGSAYQDPALLDAVDPAVALVSVGADNPYGHPNPALLARLARDGARVLRTDLDGDLAVVPRRRRVSGGRPAQGRADGLTSPTVATDLLAVSAIRTPTRGHASMAA